MKWLPLDPNKDWTSCSECGYSIGFHIGLKREGDRFVVLLHCPHCGARFATGWEFRAPEAKPEEPGS
jgi:uncharacterized Zn finger protein